MTNTEIRAAAIAAAAAAFEGHPAASIISAAKQFERYIVGSGYDD